MNGIPLLDSIPVNWFIVGTSLLAGVILFLILTQIPDDEEQESKEAKEDMAMESTEDKHPAKKKSSKR